MLDEVGEKGVSFGRVTKSDDAKRRKKAIEYL